MARWRLTTKHYLNVPGTEWEYTETDRTTGKRGRQTFIVPAHLDPNEPSDQNYPGEIVVCHEGKGQGRDIIFIGDPTPDMEPLDTEAEAISASFADRWKHPIDTLPVAGDFSQSLLNTLTKQLDAALAQRPTVPNVSAGVDPEAFKLMQEQLAALMAKNAELEKAALRRA